VAVIEDIVARYPGTARAVALDVTDQAQISAAVGAAEDQFGAVDVLVNNAGYGYRSAVEEADEADVRQLFATNFFGAVALTKAVLPGMRARRQGAIVNVSSIAGRRAIAGSGFYAASKFALEGMSQALRQEVGPLGIKVTVVEPGAFRTDFAGRSMKQSAAPIPDYAQTAGLRRKDKDTMDGRQQNDPVKGAEAIISVVENPDPPFRLLLGRDAVDVVRAEIAAQLHEIDAWEETSSRTSFMSV
jgi:NAD(P)-dependent dehydrogenase (short-subunit alcohol dehydrogenase family)